MFPVPMALWDGAAGGSGPSLLTFSASNDAAGSSTTLAITVPAEGIPAGSLIVVGGGGISATATVSGVADTAGNIYTVNATVNNASGGAAGLASCPNCSALVSGNTITVTYSAACTSRIAAAAYGAGMATSSPADGSGTGTGNSQTISATTSATGHASDIIVGFAYAKGANAVQSAQGAGYTRLSGRAEGSNADSGFDNKSVSATGTYDYTMSISTSSEQWSAVVVAYKGA